ncbi:MAG TPA: hypothetical protein VLA56_04785, partial [Pseudomonadales bacterium]|nr:hypothetical protein [Pseudomonadales bacterium]
MTDARLITTLYKGDTYAREWRMGYDGHAAVTYDAHLVADLSPAQLAEIERRNGLVRAGVEVMEAYQRLARVREPDESVPTSVP